ncbi:hypothetical protein FRC08_011663 [Ceratobasidium sp. 394]|nr:hypothetical protein FRC08_011663 [Ceratobasidium sp. 394]
MQSQSCSNYIDYREVFSLRGPQLGRPTALAVSPSGLWLCSATDNGHLAFMKTFGYASLYIHMDRTDYVTAITWTTEHEIVLGCVNGTVYMATLITRSSDEHIKICIDKFLYEIGLTIFSLAYDPTIKCLALGYSNRVSVWECDNSGMWQQIGGFSITDDESSARVNALEFFGVNHNLFVGSESGAMVWSPTGGLATLETTSSVYQISATAFAHDKSMMASSTLDEYIIIWPVSHQLPLTFLSHTYKLETGHESHAFNPRTPVAVTHDRRVVCGTSDGSVVVLSHQGQRLQTISSEAHSTRMISVSSDMLYVSFTDAVGAVTIVGYTNDNTTRDQYAELHASDQSEWPQAKFYQFSDVYRAPKLVVHTRAEPRRKHACVIVLMIIFMSLWVCWFAVGAPTNGSYTFEILM